ncbi:hypothetical protein LMH87_009497 [Akanthomyces muscarius]|uniref:chitinase n=1 Tax=Akanthomyces muscarius TaxID=2231603 RepID=A0A9W8UM80_AKAMU|nr:hypothetical protein LMH87_009497 [Akanthomyces muscarius]KAJ4152982.1 hypothetical protein LMH87_009497 [Akanthomyces muscarius]
MPLSEIPVEMLTHLNVAFGYITDDFKVTNMDGVSADLFHNVGNVKARNPDLKIMIAIGGWTFSDPGPWQNKFPTMVATAASRSTFIQNLLGFLQEYGYDGVDFDWEYPAADDRGGSPADSIKYGIFLKELRAAIDASGHKYLVTFTAPSSYWYLRHFRLDLMEPYVDWINLMSYDIHGVWDGSNPIGNHVLSHTNLTEIDLALDLFWRAKVKPSSIVLGLGFYGRSFTLSDNNCWKPGCLFSGPGAAGRCTNTPGILSYREIQELIYQTGATAYTDKAAAAKYIVYGNNSWISFDDQETFKAKIDYANKVGLSGLMIWAIDLDDGDLSALSAVTGRNVGQNNGKFTLTDLKNLFPSEMLPSSPDDVVYALTTFSGQSDTGYSNPRESGFGFMLMSGEKHVVSRLRRREGDPEPFTFLDCPGNIDSDDGDITYTARVVCLSDDIEGCFQVMIGGIEGTAVEMPDNCAPNTIARALSLTPSKDQALPEDMHGTDPTSLIFDFSFDFNMLRVRQDSEQTSVRIDFSTSPDYWVNILDTPGIQSRDLEGRFFAPTAAQWESRFVEGNFRRKYAFSIKETVSTPLFWNTAKECDFQGDGGFIEGVAAYIAGDIDVKVDYGFSAVYRYKKDDSLDLYQASGYIDPKGKIDMSYGVGGVADIDVTKGTGSNPAFADGVSKRIDKQSLTLYGGAKITFAPYYALEYAMATYNSSDASAPNNGVAAFDGLLTSRVVTDVANFTAYYPPKDGDELETKKLNDVSVQDHNIIYTSTEAGGKIGLESILSIGLNITVNHYKNKPAPVNVELELGYTTLAMYTWRPGDGADEGKTCIDYDIGTLGWQSASNGNRFGWKDGAVREAQSDEQTSAAAPKCFADLDPNGEEKRANLPLVETTKALAARQGDPEMPGWDYKPFEFPSPLKYVGFVGGNGPAGDIVNFNNGGLFKGKAKPEKVHQLVPRASGTATLGNKMGRLCSKPRVSLGGNGRYPSFPADASFPWNGIDNHRWDSIPRYWGNATGTCDDWTVKKWSTHDTRWVNGAFERAKYQTEHVFEAQIIADFFSNWLDSGKITNQRPIPSNPSPKMPCALSERYVWPSSNDWKVAGKAEGFFKVLLGELGSIRHLDRLTVFLARPNRMKGAMFEGNKAVAEATYLIMSADEQLSAVKEMGMAFTYLNEADVWDAFCATYEGIYDRLGEYNTWWANNPPAGPISIPDLQKEWKDYMKVVMDSMVTRAKADFDFMFLNRKGVNQDPYKSAWTYNRLFNRGLIRFGRTCKNMDQSTA